MPVLFDALSAVEVFESHFTPCCGDSVALVGSAESSPRGKRLSVGLGRCPSCEAWQWRESLELPSPFVSAIQTGMHLQRLRAEVLAQPY